MRDWRFAQGTHHVKGIGNEGEGVDGISYRKLMSAKLDAAPEGGK